jgi:hypothetical protein
MYHFPSWLINRYKCLPLVLFSFFLLGQLYNHLCFEFWNDQSTYFNVFPFSASGVIIILCLWVFHRWVIKSWWSSSTPHTSGSSLLTPMATSPYGIGSTARYQLCHSWSIWPRGIERGLCFRSIDLTLLLNLLVRLRSSMSLKRTMFGSVLEAHWSSFSFLFFFFS